MSPPAPTTAIAPVGTSTLEGLLRTALWLWAALVMNEVPNRCQGQAHPKHPPLPKG